MNLTGPSKITKISLQASGPVHPQPRVFFVSSSTLEPGKSFSGASGSKLRAGIVLENERYKLQSLYPVSKSQWRLL